VSKTFNPKKSFLNVLPTILIDGIYHSKNDASFFLLNLAFL